MADIPAGTGLGSSGAFTVGGCRRSTPPPRALVRTSSSPSRRATIELERLGEPIGKQDQYIAAVGGITAFDFHPDGASSIAPVELARRARAPARGQPPALLHRRPPLGVRRPGGRDERDAPRRPSAADLADNLDAGEGARARDRGRPRGGDLDPSATLLTRAVGAQVRRAPPSAVHDQVDEWIRAGIDAGAARRQARRRGRRRLPALLRRRQGRALRAAMAALGLDEVRFRIDYEGSTVDRGRVAVLPVACARRRARHPPAGTSPATPARRRWCRSPGVRSSTGSSPSSRDEGARDVLLLVAHGADAIRDHVGDGSALGLRVELPRRRPRPPGHRRVASARAVPDLAETFWVTYGDTLLDVDIRRGGSRARPRPHGRCS